jgi:hypothetical protein
VLVVLAGLTVAQPGFEELALSRPLYCTVAVKVLARPGVLSSRGDGLTVSGTGGPFLARSGAVARGSELQALRKAAATRTAAAGERT